MVDWLIGAIFARRESIIDAIGMCAGESLLVCI